MLENDIMETASTEVTSIWRGNDKVKIHVENSWIFRRFWKSNPRPNIHVEAMS